MKPEKIYQRAKRKETLFKSSLKLCINCMTNDELRVEDPWVGRKEPRVINSMNDDTLVSKE